MTKRNVRWYEDRQERAIERAERIGRYMRRLVDRAAAIRAEAQRTKSPKKKQTLEDQAFRMSMKVRRLGDLAQAARQESSRYGKAKTKDGIYDPVYGWSDRPSQARDRAERRGPSFAERLYETRLLRERVNVDFLPLFDHLLDLARGSDKHGNPQRAGRELAAARKLTKRGTTPGTEDYASFPYRRGIGMFSKRVTSTATERDKRTKAARRTRPTR